MNKKEIGKKSRNAGKAFEVRCRAFLEKQGWIVDRWTNNVELQKENSKEVYGFHNGEKFIYGRLVPSRPKFIFNSKTKTRQILGLHSGFPDFIIFKKLREEPFCKECNRPTNVDDGWCFGCSTTPGKDNLETKKLYEVIGVECKIHGKLDKEEKEKAKWYLKSKIFSKFIILSKGEKRGQIEVNDILPTP